MINGGVSLEDYQDGSFGAHNMAGQEVGLSDIEKALSAGNGGSGGSMANQASAAGNYQPAIVESLEAKLKYLTLQRQELKLWNAVKTSPAFALSEEFLQLTDIGSDRGGFHNEFDLPETEDTTYERKSEKVKYLGVTRAISHQAQLVRTNLGDVIDREVNNGTLWMLRKNNRSLAFGSSRVVDAEYNGIYEQHAYYGAATPYATMEDYFASDVLIDMRGGSLKQENFFDGALAIDENHGFADAIYGPNQVIVDLAKDYIEKQRILLGTSTTNTYGTVPKVITTPHGDIQLNIDKYLRNAKTRRTTESATSPKAPAGPTPDGVTPLAVVTDTTTKFGADDNGDGAGDGSGDYYYAVAAVNRFGESAPIALSAAKLTISATQAAVLKFAAASGTYAATGFVIYRSKKNPAGAITTVDLYPIFSIGAAEVASGFDGGTAGTVRDKNRFIAGCEQAFLWQTGDEVFEVKQLAPLMKMNLAQLDPTMRFMVLMYLTPQLYAPKKIVRYINIGKFA